MMSSSKDRPELKVDVVGGARVGRGMQTRKALTCGCGEKNVARLGLTDDEKKIYAEQLSTILDYFQQLNEIDTKDVEPSAQVTGLLNIYREDLVNACDDKTRKELLQQAPETEGDLVKSKSVFE